MGALDKLDPEQKLAASCLEGPLCIIAGAGTGKTRTVTHRIAYGVEQGVWKAEECLAVTHSKKAAGELNERLMALGVGRVESKTFHAAALKVVAAHWYLTGRPGTGPAILGERDCWRYVRSVIESMVPGEVDQAVVRDIMDEMSWGRSQNLKSSEYKKAALHKGRNSEVDSALVKKVWDGFEEMKKAREVVDFSDLLSLASEVLENNPEVQAELASKWKYITVDEYQDTDVAQQRFLEAVLGSSKNVCVVGDSRQSIYSWRGAEPKYLAEFGKKYGAKVVELIRNYRSTEEILVWGNKLATVRGVKELVGTRGHGVACEIIACNDEESETRRVVMLVKDAISRGVEAREIAVLYRFNATQARVEAALAQANIATTVSEDVTFFEREEVRGVLVPFGQRARRDPEVEGLAIIEAILAERGFNRDVVPDGQGAVRQRWESWNALLELLESLDDGCSAEEMLRDINELARATSGPRGQGVVLSTLHRAKGLEWDEVIIVGCTEGAIPSAYAKTMEALDEEERLLHVGVTRARKKLVITWAERNGRGWRNKRSSYLDRLSWSGTSAPVSAKTKSGDIEGSSKCKVCGTRLKGMAARTLGYCTEDIIKAPGEIGSKARELVKLSKEAGLASSRKPENILNSGGLLRLVSSKGLNARMVSDTMGVDFTGEWAKKAAEILK